MARLDPRRRDLLPIAEARLGEHHRTVVLVFPIVGVAMLGGAHLFALSWLEVLSGSAPLIVVANLVMSAPLIVGLWPLLDRKALAGLAVMVLYSYTIESIGVVTGVPYGSFEYQANVGPMLLGLVPIALPLYWLPMLLSALVLATSLVGLQERRSSIRRRATIWAAATVLTVGLDLVLDPGAVGIGMWEWSPPGPYYGVPAVNYLGWLLSAGLGTFIFASTLDMPRLYARVAEFPLIFDTVLAFLIFWGGINALLGQVFPVLLALVLGAGVLKAMQLRAHSPRSSRRDGAQLAGGVQ